MVMHVDTVQALQRGVLAGVAVLAMAIAPAPQTRRPVVVSAVPAVSAVAAPIATPSFGVRHADFGRHKPSPEVRYVADWVADSRDNAGAQFILLDKRLATLYVFDAQARLRATSPVLLGAARGDDSVAGIGVRPIAEVRPHERTTPAGRFATQRGHNALGEDVVWVDYDAAVSMHRVRATAPKERRLERLASKTIADNRITYGCINVPVAFYEAFLRTGASTRSAIVYVLPEQRTAQQVFGSYDVAAHHAAVLAFQAHAAALPAWPPRSL